MVMSPVELWTKNQCAGEDQQQLLVIQSYRYDITSRLVTETEIVSETSDTSYILIPLVAYKELIT
jgi:hypothetical protein